MLAYILITTAYGKAHEVANKLMKLHCIKDINITQGEYNIVALVNAKNEGKLANIEYENIRKLEGVSLVSPLIIRN